MSILQVFPEIARCRCSSHFTKYALALAPFLLKSRTMAITFRSCNRMCYQFSQIKYFFSNATIFSKSIDANIVMIYSELYRVILFHVVTVRSCKTAKIRHSEFFVVRLSIHRGCSHMRVRILMKFCSIVAHPMPFRSMNSMTQ